MVINLNKPSKREVTRVPRRTVRFARFFEGAFVRHDPRRDCSCIKNVQESSPEQLPVHNQDREV